MKIVKRVSLYKAVDRLATPSGSWPKMDHAYYRQSAPWRMSTDMELFKYGYRNKPRMLTMGVLGTLALIMGFTMYSTEIELRNVHFC